MNTTTDRVNRTVLTLLGLVLTIMGAYFLVRSSGALFDRDALLVGPDLREWAQDNRDWLFVVAGALFAILVVLGLWWLVAQTRRWEHASNDLTYYGHQPVEWRGVVSAGAVESAVSSSVTRHDDVDDAAVRLDLDAEPPYAELRVTAHRGADLRSLTGWIHDEVLAPTAAALERPPLAAHIRYRLVEAPTRTVR